MPITTSCPQCKALFRLPDNLAGKALRCEKCQQMFAVPLTGRGGAETVVAILLPGSAELAANPPVSMDDSEAPIEAELAEPTTAHDDVIEATLAEAPIAAQVVGTGSAPPPLPKDQAAPKPSSPVPADRPVTTGWALAALVGFLLAMLGTGMLAAYWVFADLSPPTPLAFVPPLRVAEKNDAKNQPFADRNKDENGERRPLEPVLLPLLNGKGYVNGGLQFPNPQFDPGRFGQDGRFCLYRVPLEQGKRYNFMVTAINFMPRLRLYDGDALVGQNQVEVLTGRRVFISYQADRTGDHLLHLTSAGWQAGNFDLHVALVAPAEVFPIALRAGEVFRIRHELRVEDPIDPLAPATFGPYRDYAVRLDANQEYVFKVANTNFPPMLCLYDDQDMAVGKRTGELTYRPRVAGNFRLRVTSENAGTGNYVLQAARREDFPVDKRLQTIIATFDEDNRYVDERALTGADPNEPKINRGAYKAYLVPLEQGATYAFTLSSKDFVTRMSLFDPDGKHIREGVGNIREKESRLVYLCVRTGVYRVHVVSASPKKNGEYTLSITK